MAIRTVDPLATAALTERERETVQLFAPRMRGALGDDLGAIWLYGSRARGEAHAESDVDLLVIAHGGRDRYQRIDSFFIQEVDRDKLVLAGSALR